MQPLREELRIKEYELYKSVYCGLCRELGRRYGILSRLTLSYDCTVLAMLAVAVKGEDCVVTKGRCTCNPLKKCLYCSAGGESFALAGAVSVIMAYYKLTDTIEDGGFFKRMGARVLRGFLARNYRRAERAYPEIAEKTKDMILAQIQLERSADASGMDTGTPVSVDRAAEPTAKLLSALCEMLTDDDAQKRVLSVFGYFVGRWVYIMDAADDLEKDLRRGRFNPFAACVKDDWHQTMLYCNEVLNVTVSEMIAAYDLIELHSYRSVLDNIIYDGLGAQQRKCLFEKRNKKKATKSKEYYRYPSDLHDSGK